MALKTEDGTGVADADAFVDRTFADTFLGDRSFTLWGEATEEDRDAAIRRATAWLSNYYRWKGSRVKARQQALAWPRSGVRDGGGHTVPDDAVPVELQHATCLAALFELGNPGGLTPSLAPNEQLKREKIGPLEFAYRDTSRPENDMSGIDSSRPVVSAVQDLVRGLVETPMAVGITVA